VNDVRFGVGPFAAIGVDDQDLLNGVGGGIMIGGKRVTGSGDAATSFNLGIGPYLVGEIQTLASGFSEGQAPPGGATEVRYRTEEDWKLLVMFSFSWSI